MAPRSVFIVGPGLIGWTVLDQLLEAGVSDITALVRREEHGAAIQKVSSDKIKIVQGDLNDKELITRVAAEHDITFHTATADHIPSVQAVLDGFKQRADKGLDSIYIHTSGASLLADDSISKYKSDRIYTDKDPESIDALDEKQPHRDVDLTIVNFVRNQANDKIKAAIMIPPLIYGYNPSHDRLTIQLPYLAKFALKHKYSGYLGAGLGVSGGINVADLARGYLTVLKNIENSTLSAAALRKNPYFFCENGVEYSWKEAADQVGRSLKAKGFLDDAEPREIPRNQWDDLFGEGSPVTFGMNARSKADRLRELGWKPREKGQWDSWWEDELPALLKKEGKI